MSRHVLDQIRQHLRQRPGRSVGIDLPSGPVEITRVDDALQYCGKGLMVNGEYVEAHKVYFS